MEYYIVMPAYNEAACIEATLDSVVRQTLLPKKLVVVDDGSTDTTARIVEHYAQKHDWIALIQRQSDKGHQPGSKVVRAFEEGLAVLDYAYDFIVKLDADLILPDNYFQTIALNFAKNSKAGMAGGFAYIEKDSTWILENLTGRDHIRGAFKAYRQACFTDIGGLRPSMGWDTADELLSRYYGWEVITLPELKVKHLKPTGAHYDASAPYKQGEAFYKLGYDLPLTIIASIKLSFRKKSPLLTLRYLKGFFHAKKQRIPQLVTKEQAVFVRQYRWRKICSKLF